MAVLGSYTETSTLWGRSLDRDNFSAAHVLHVELSMTTVTALAMMLLAARSRRCLAINPMGDVLMLLRNQWAIPKAVLYI
jgi:hypothetical protein